MKEPPVLLTENKIESQPFEPSSPRHDEGPAGFPVYLVGAVARPGIYLVQPGSCLYEVVEQAGGLTGEAAADAINLAASLESNQLVRIPTRSEVEEGYKIGLIEGQAQEAGLVDLNKADQELLETLPGIGPATARAILAYRKENGGFNTIEELMLVPGIKEARFAPLKDLVMVSSP